MKAKTKRILAAIAAPPIITVAGVGFALLVHKFGVWVLLAVAVGGVSCMAYTYPGWKDDE